MLHKYKIFIIIIIIYFYFYFNHEKHDSKFFNDVGEFFDVSRFRFENSYFGVFIDIYNRSDNDDRFNKAIIYIGIFGSKIFCDMVFNRKHSMFSLNIFFDGSKKAMRKSFGSNKVSSICSFVWKYNMFFNIWFIRVFKDNSFIICWYSILCFGLVCFKLHSNGKNLLWKMFKKFVV